MRYSIVTAIVVLFTSLCWAQGPGTPVGGPGTVVVQETSTPTIAPSPEPQQQSAGGQRITEPQRQELGKLLVNWKTEDRAARTAEAAGNQMVAQDHRARANALAKEICQLRRQVQGLGKEYKNTQDYLHRENGYFVELQGAGFITRGQADQRYVMNPPALTPASSDTPPAETPAKGDGNMGGAVTIGGLGWWALAATLIIWSLVLLGNLISVRWGPLSRVYGGGQNGGNGQGQNVDPGYMGAYRSAIEAPRPPAAVGGSLPRGGRYTDREGRTSSWESWEPDRTAQSAALTPQVPGVLDIDLRDLNLVLPAEGEPPFGQGRR